MRLRERVWAALRDDASGAESRALLLVAVVVGVILLLVLILRCANSVVPFPL